MNLLSDDDFIYPGLFYYYIILCLSITLYEAHSQNWEAGFFLRNVSERSVRIRVGPFPEHTRPPSQLASSVPTLRANRMEHEIPNNDFRNMWSSTSIPIWWCLFKTMYKIIILCILIFMQPTEVRDV
jgi:hypothetical protein